MFVQVEETAPAGEREAIEVVLDDGGQWAVRQLRLLEAAGVQVRRALSSKQPPKSRARSGGERDVSSELVPKNELSAGCARGRRLPERNSGLAKPAATQCGAPSLRSEAVLIRLWDPSEVESSKPDIAARADLTRYAERSRSRQRSRFIFRLNKPWVCNRVRRFQKRRSSCRAACFIDLVFAFLAFVADIFGHL